MESIKFDYHSPRAYKARLSLRLAPIIWLVGLLSAMLALVGLAFLVFWEDSIGWSFLGLVSIGLMIIAWQYGELKHLKPNSGSALDDLLEKDILGRLPAKPTVVDLAQNLIHSNAAHFMRVRFGLSPRLVSDLASSSDIDLDDVWQKALALHKTTGTDMVDGAILAVAITSSFANFEQIIAQIHLDPADLVDGIIWRKHIKDLFDQAEKPVKTGGFARDWSFGYTNLLSRFGRNISQPGRLGPSLTVDIKSHREAIDELISTMGGNGSRSVVLVGASGAGKTTIVNGLAERLVNVDKTIPSNLHYQQIFMLDASALIAAANQRGELEGLIHEVLVEAFSAKNIIICLDNAHLFFEEGVGSVDLTNVFQPILEAGRLRIILTIDEQRYLKINQRDPMLFNSIHRINVKEASRDDTLRVMQERVLEFETHHKVAYTYQALKEAYNLSKRYMYELVMPGRAIKLLKLAAKYNQGGLVTVNSVQQAIEKNLDVKVSVASDYADKEMLLNLEDHIHQRMINQVRAVSAVSDALRRARTGVRNQDRPIGTFLFLGPTGVGKTELAKALADVYFGGEDKIIRLDLNEFVRAEDVSRLIADGADDASSLTAQVIKKPFSVVLLDEIEKASPEVLATLLQLLDEGILRDVKNREVSFRDAIVIATSNAGAERIREYVERGYDVSRFEEQFFDELVETRQFRPEFLNRFDEVVVFTPLSKDDLLKAVDLMIAGVNKTLESQKISVQVEPAARELLVERGYDPRLGARPMRRIVQKVVENTVAKAMLASQLQTGGQIVITADKVDQITGASQPALDEAAQPSLGGYDSKDSYANLDVGDSSGNKLS